MALVPRSAHHTFVLSMHDEMLFCIRIKLKMQEDCQGWLCGPASEYSPMGQVGQLWYFARRPFEANGQLVDGCMQRDMYSSGE